LGNNLGLAIIGLTAVIRGALAPLTAPSLKSAEKLRSLQPELNKLKEKYGKDRQKFSQKQLELYQKHGVNPAAGCLPQVVQIIILIALSQAFNKVLVADGVVVANLNEVLYSPLKLAENAVINTRFLYLDLVKPDLFSIPAINLGPLSLNHLPGIFLIAAAISQFVSSKMMMPAAKGTEAKAKKSPEKTDDMAAAMQEQMLYLMPIMTIFIGFRFPSGLVLYWLTFSVFMLLQQLLLKRAKTNGK
jgi:YidC/Oxa1 family membrane protein insertase